MNEGMKYVLMVSKEKTPRQQNQTKQDYLNINYSITIETCHFIGQHVIHNWKKTTVKHLISDD